MTNFNNMGTGKKMLAQVLSLTGSKVKHWYNKQNLTDNKLSNNYNIQLKNSSENKK